MAGSIVWMFAAGLLFWASSNADPANRRIVWTLPLLLVPTRQAPPGDASGRRSWFCDDCLA